MIDEKQPTRKEIDRAHFRTKPKATQKADWASLGRNREVNSIFPLQRTAANRPNPGCSRANSNTVTPFGHSFSRIPVQVQSKLKISAPGDIYEQEADRVAARVMSAPEPSVQRACACGGTCSHCKGEQLGK